MGNDCYHLQDIKENFDNIWETIAIIYKPNTDVK